MSPDGLDLHALDGFLKEHVDGYRGGVTAELVSGGRSNLTYRVTDGESVWVLRRPPLGNLTPSAHDMGREYRFVAALAGSGVPVAPAVALADESVIGVPFALTGFVDGVVVRSEDDLAAYTDGQVRDTAFALVDTLAALHAVDATTGAVSGLGKPAGYLRRQVDRWYSQWERVKTRELGDVEALYARLDAICPAESDAAVVHGDYRIDNAILDPADPTRIRALVDWEMATLGDPLADLALHTAYGDPVFAPVLAGSAASTSARMPGADELVERYVATSGREPRDWSFHRGLAYFKIAVIAEGIHERHVRGDTRGDGFATVGEATAPLAAAGLTAATT
ncbi:MULTISPECIES: phosphotransferase family protein [unclassified Pseudonocardia]|uniref:phosphotransferase family protein n=1 Tax=unclassified Pseudonocardia TaxID=2619320 RepID=UPI0001FFE6DD|nr:phosphotransferase family protein [Pseudonocardia sp. Ae707_Ps1]OLM21121.1 putative ACYL-CoA DEHYDROGENASE FADE36 [Pseudonocardia sp. Ae707_Ps1]